MLNSTNWNSVRFKIPIDDDIGWRVEFRTLEVQVTAEENSLFSILIFSIVRMINRFPKVNFYIPMSLIEKNFERAHKNNAILLEKFYFRINVYEDGEPIIKELTLY
jgi:glutamate--cysteine ligase catalytic subunit